MILKILRKLGIANLNKMPMAFLFMGFQGRGSRMRKNGRKLTFHNTRCAIIYLNLNLG